MLADGIAIYFCGWCYTTCIYFVISLDCQLAGVIAIMWKMVNHIYMFKLLADVIAMVADGMAT